ncbi:ATP phosphoribosyltransferase [Candidatus Daviesbacteria bacterium]|nr:ATP phosphoribosyltransferase [Candidatus Daviesbacteria bacterium]
MFELEQRKLRLGMPKENRLTVNSEELLRKAGLRFRSPTTDGRLRVPVANLPIDLYYFRSRDMVRVMERGAIDLGINGEDTVAELGKGVTEVLPLNIGECRLIVAVPRKSGYKSVEDLNGKEIATPYPHLAERFFQENGVDCEFYYQRGSLEITPRLRLAEAIFDITNTGRAVNRHRLRELAEARPVQAALFARPGLEIGSERIAWFIDLLRNTVLGSQPELASE